ncbi:MAG: NAD(+)/NADH kinase [Ruminococcus sp.]|nr:NAD(+)/NADH kinase [Ruminococcus sp.]
MKAYIFPNFDKQNCKEYTIEACKVLHDSGIGISIDADYKELIAPGFEIEYGDEAELIKDCDVVIAIGGDGTIIRCAGLAAMWSKPVLGINCGRLGFMASLEKSELGLLSKLKDDNIPKSKRMMLKALVYKNGRLKGTFHALNDVVISKRHNSKIADFEVSKEGNVISSLRADGIIFSTPTGATAYSMSAGGPIIEPDLECIEFTQICPHTLFARSIIFSASSVLSVKCHANLDAKAMVSVDGENVFEIGVNDKVIISRSEYSIELIDLIGGSFFNSVNTKLMQPLKGTGEGLL